MESDRAASQGTDFRTHSLFFNDQWRLSGRVTVNLGVRWDKNSGKDSADQVVADDSAFSPRWRSRGIRPVTRAGP